uniref:Uncharacterized protein n=1 Tax=Coptotermes formosanus TaxID=36987 RepID=R4UXF0_COPFO|nr:hypothetical protein [Coptotermes formosanus]
MINSNLIFLHNEKSVSKISKCKFNNISNVNQPLIYLTNDKTVFDNNCIFACKHPVSWLVVENQMKRMTNKPFHNFGHILVPRKLKKCASETKFDKIKQEKSIEQSSTVSSSMKMITKLLLTSFTQFSLYIKLAKRASLSSGKTFSPQKLLGKNYAFNNADSTIFLPKLAPKADSDSGSSKSAFDWHCIVLIILSIIIIVIIVLIVLLFLKIKGGGGGGGLHPNDDRASVNTGLNDQGLTGVVPDDVADVIPF